MTEKEIINKLSNGGGTRIRTGDKGFADLCLTTWLCRLIENKDKMERKTGFEPATPTLARWCSTPELFPLDCGTLQSIESAITIKTYLFRLCQP